MENQILLSGPVETIGPQIIAARAAARAAHGWIMDLYLLDKSA
jgi:precorrin-6A synthase